MSFPYRMQSLLAVFLLVPFLSAIAADNTNHPVLTGQAAFTDACTSLPGHPPPSDRRGSARSRAGPIRRQRRPRGSAASECLADRSQRIQGGAVCHRPRQSAPAPHRAQRRHLPRRERSRESSGSFAASAPTARPKPTSGLRRRACNLPFGIAFYPAGPNPKWVYVGNTDGIVRFPYKTGDLKATGPPENLAELPGGGRLRGGGHWTRDLVFSKDGSKLFASVGSHSNVDDTDTHPEEFHRADVLQFTPDGKFLKVYAWGIRNCVGEAINPITGELWCSTNERDGLGNNLVPDYVTHVQEGGFYGWPW